MLNDFLIHFKAWLPNNYALVFNVFVIILISMITSVIVQGLLKRLTERLQRTHSQWDEALTKSLSKPLSYLIWLIGISIAVHVIRPFETEDSFLRNFSIVRDMTVFCLIGWFLIRLTKSFEVAYLRKGQFDQTTIQAISKLVRSTVFITIALLLLQELGYSIKGFLAFGGIGGIAVGFAAKDMLANVFGGVVIYFDRPFSVGDWIRSPDQEIEGHVEHIGWRSTKIRTFDKRPLYVPNSTFNQISIQNPSRMTNRRIKETFGIRYRDFTQVTDIADQVREMLRNHPEIDNNQTLIVNFNAFAPSSLDFLVYTFTKTTIWIKYHEIKQDVLVKIMDIVAENGAQMAFPTSTVHLLKEAEEAEIPINGTEIET